LKDNYTLGRVKNKDLYNFFIEFETARQKNNRISEDNTDYDLDLAKYHTACINSPDSESGIRDRHEILLKKFFLKHKNVETKDNQRGFTQTQKEAIYYLNNRQCTGYSEVECPVKGHTLGFTELEYDHIIEHSNGGATAVENGQPYAQSVINTKQENM
ncbi:hypothetical protein, partial [Pontibacter sp. BAB1700]|uniref:hypothetical protein n=1 Tax=Pontibacter sp. BAB1700 TaxID=1144253 RepID=UPI00026BED4C